MEEGWGGFGFQGLGFWDLALRAANITGVLRSNGAWLVRSAQSLQVVARSSRLEGFGGRSLSVIRQRFWTLGFASSFLDDCFADLTWNILAFWHA